MIHPISCHLNVLIPSVEDRALPGALDALAAAGCDWVGLPPLPADVDVRRLGGALGAAGLAPVVFAVQRADADASSEEPAVRQAGRDALRRAVDVAGELGAAHLTGVPYAPFGLSAPWSTAARARAAASVGELAQLAAEAGIPLTIEILNRYESSAINTVADGLAFLDEVGAEHVGIHADTFHMMIEEPDAPAAIRALGPRLGFLELGQSGRGELGSGSADIERVIRAAIDAGYTGPVAFEAFSRAVLPEGMADRLAVWRAPYEDGAALVRSAVATIRGVLAGAASDCD
ncbi:sugar phosphate isomerase/epimerase family protein [Microbacterium album]|uniref:Xylose isomerase-like TIM barrel domain-containing protein n=1 Tax=Microbacterium album TaxID=2053191 RepID=A0A917MPY1_9MICO|nr:sugar phosphate isomerase/epimerase family protein [Microbacterium album]GGH49409.1 hypothetical protein GCM10010921_27540 [Microbacterium album]